MRHIFFSILILLLLSGCWDNQELDNTGIVHGVGFKKSDDKMRLSVEVIKPENDDEGESGEDEGPGSGDHIVLEQNADTLLEGARELIKFTKRRLNFSHNEAWIINEELAEDSFVQSLDIIRRDQMLRLNSLLFITPDDPADILNTPTLYDNLVSIELASAVKNTKYLADYAPITVREFYKLLEGAVESAYLPIIYLNKTKNQILTAINGTAVIKGDHMVGKLNTEETAGLNLLLNNVKGGNIQSELNEEQKVSMEISTSSSKTTPRIKGNELDIDFETTIEGELADNMTTKETDEGFYKEVENSISKEVKDTILGTVKKLQEELETDILDIGAQIHRKYPKKWQHIKSDWTEIFTNAKVTVDVDVNITHQGLINDNMNRYKRPINNPFLKDDE